MRNTDFSAASPGRLVSIPNGFHAFVPSAIPRGRTVDHGTLRLIGHARAALGQLDAGIASLPNPQLFVTPFQTNEAVLSSRIEGTRTSLEEALVNEVSGVANYEADADARAVRNYQHALSLGITELSTGKPLSLPLIRSLQAVIVKDDPKLAPFAGKVRDRQVVIGPPAASFDFSLARFVPPPPEHLQDCLDDLARYCDERDAEEPLVRIALLHYQFEAIHPFADGNGRVGRLLIPLQMVREGVVRQPWVYLSAEIEKRKEEYVAALYAVSTTGAFEAWLRFFAEVTLASARTTQDKLDRLRALERALHDRLKGYRGDLLLRILPEIFRWPVITIPGVVRTLGCTKSAARNAILELEQRNVVRKFERPRRHGRTGRPPDMYMCSEVIEIVMRP